MTNPGAGQTVGEKVVAPLRSRPEELYQLVVDIYEALKDKSELDQAISAAEGEGQQLSEPPAVPVSPAAGLVTHPAAAARGGLVETHHPPPAAHIAQSVALKPPALPPADSGTAPLWPAGPTEVATVTEAVAGEAAAAGDDGDAAAEFEKELLAAEAAGRAGIPDSRRESTEFWGELEAAEETDQQQREQSGDGFGAADGSSLSFSGAEPEQDPGVTAAVIGTADNGGGGGGSGGGMRDEHATTRSSLSFGLEGGDDAATAADGEGPPSLSGDGTDSHLKRQVQSLLQRTDSMLSRSSDRNARQRGASVSDLNSFPAASGAGGILPTPIDTRAGPSGFGFLDEPPPEDAAETPTLRSGGATPAMTRSPSGARRRVVAFDGVGGAGAGSRASLASGGGGGRGPAAYGVGGLSVAGGGGATGLLPHRRRPSTSDTPDMHSPGSDVQGVGGLGGLSYAASSRSLSQAELSDLAEREQQLQQYSRGDASLGAYSGPRSPFDRSTGGAQYDSGASADRTTVVLGKSASFQVQRERERAAAAAAAAAAAGSSGGGTGTSPGSGPYQSFAPLEELVNAVTEAASVAAATRPSVGPAAGAPRSGGGTSAASSGAPSVVRRGVLPLLQPEFILTPKVSRLKAELASVARRSSPTPAAFEERLEQVLARVLQFELEGASARKFRVLLDSALDDAFARAAAAGGRRTAAATRSKSATPATPGTGGLWAGPAATELSWPQQQQQPQQAKVVLPAGTPPRSRRATQQAVLELGTGASALAAGVAPQPLDQPQQAPQQQPDAVGAGTAAAPAAGAEAASTMQAAFAKLMAAQAALRGGTAADAPIDAAAAPACVMGLQGQQAAGFIGRGSLTGMQTGRRLSIGGSPEIGLSPAVSQTGSIAGGPGAAGLMQLALAGGDGQQQQGVFAGSGGGRVAVVMGIRPPSSRRGTRQQQVPAGSLGLLGPTTAGAVASAVEWGALAGNSPEGMAAAAAVAAEAEAAGAVERWEALQDSVAAIVVARSPEPVDVWDELARQGLVAARAASPPCPCCGSPAAAPSAAQRNQQQQRSPCQHQVQRADGPESPAAAGPPAGPPGCAVQPSRALSLGDWRLCDAPASRDASVVSCWQQQQQQQQQGSPPPAEADADGGPPEGRDNGSGWRCAQLLGAPSWLASLRMCRDSDAGGSAAAEGPALWHGQQGEDRGSPAATSCDTWLSPARREGKRAPPPPATEQHAGWCASPPGSPGWGQHAAAGSQFKQRRLPPKPMSSPLQQQQSPAAGGMQGQAKQQRYWAPSAVSTPPPASPPAAAAHTRLRRSSGGSEALSGPLAAEGPPRQQVSQGREALELTSRGPVRITVMGMQQQSSLLAPAGTAGPVPGHRLQ